MCQPGRPAPSGAVPERLVASWRFPQDEIARVGLVVLVDVDAGAGADAAEVVVRQLAVPGKLRDAVVDRAVADVGVARASRASGWPPPCRRCDRWPCTSRSGRSRRSVAVSSRNACVYFSVYSRDATCAPPTALRMILSSTSVMFITWSSLIAARPQPAAQDVLKREGAQVADVDVVVDRGSAGVHAHRCCRAAA